MTGACYLYAYFHGDESLDDDQQVRFALGGDALHWEPLNDGEPVLRSTVGDHGARDPFLVRLPGGGFVLLATDLNTKHPRYADDQGRPDWDAMQAEGSHAMLVWRSDDLIDWHGPEPVDMVGDLPLGNVWAPKATYVPERGEYLVYWSSADAGDVSLKERIHARWTADFRTFSDPFLLIARDHSCIDAELTRVGGRWVLYLKNETDKTVGVYVSSRLFDDGAAEVGNGRGALSSAFERVPHPSLDALRGIEGPAAVRRDDDVVLYVDEYMGLKRGYLPLVADDPARPGGFALVPADGYRMPDGARHGSILRVTGVEAERLRRRWR